MTSLVLHSPLRGRAVLTLAALGELPAQHMLRLTLADVAAELGISPGTLMHRFGSKRGLLLALLQRSLGRVEERFAAMRAMHASAHAMLLALGDLMARYVQSPAALANHLAFLQVDLADDEFRRLTLAQAIQATMNGSLLQWAIDPQGKLAPWIRANLATVLRPLSRGRGLQRTRR